MRDKIITYSHFDYINEIVKILGFNNLADFETSISYNNIKKSQNKICKVINDSLENFKQIFPADKFNLRKINYQFKNINQVLGFVKKIFNYLSINYCYSRIQGNNLLRLLPENNIYNKYIPIPSFF